MSFFSVIKSSIVLSPSLVIVNEITGFTPSILGPTTAISGAPGVAFLSGCCNNHPSGTRNEMPSSWFSNT